MAMGGKTCQRGHHQQAQQKCSAKFGPSELRGFGVDLLGVVELLCRDPLAGPPQNLSGFVLLDHLGRLVASLKFQLGSSVPIKGDGGLCVGPNDFTR